MYHCHILDHEDAGMMGQFVVDCFLGDIDCDGLINSLDIQFFVNQLLTGSYTTRADVNQDGFVNDADVPGFVSLLVP